MGNQSISTDMTNLAMELLNNGWTVTETVEVLGVSVRSIQQREDNVAVKGKVNPCSMF